MLLINFGKKFFMNNHIVEKIGASWKVGLDQNRNLQAMNH